MKGKLTLGQWLIKISMNLCGLFLCGFSIVLAIQSGLGASPWAVLQAGTTNYLPITVGQASQGISLILMLFTWYKGIIPGVGTILNTIFIGYFIDFTYKYIKISEPKSIIFSILMLIGSILIFAFGIVISLKAKIGVGSRDQLMEYLIGSTKKSVVEIRSIIEGVALALGIVVGGPYGIGSVVTVVTLGYAIGFAAKILNYNFDAYAHITLADMFDKISVNKSIEIMEEKP